MGGITRASADRQRRGCSGQLGRRGDGAGAVDVQCSVRGSSWGGAHHPFPRPDLCGPPLFGLLRSLVRLGNLGLLPTACALPPVWLLLSCRMATRTIVVAVAAIVLRALAVIHLGRRLGPTSSGVGGPLPLLVRKPACTAQAQEHAWSDSDEADPWGRAQLSGRGSAVHAGVSGAGFLIAVGLVGRLGHVGRTRVASALQPRLLDPPP